MDTIKIHPKDNVAVALRPLSAGETAEGVPAAERIPQGHKMALTHLSPGDKIIKYGCPIGHSTAVIRPGQWVHEHNMATDLTGEDSYIYQPDFHPLERRNPDYFMGYRREDGRAAVRNEIWIIPAVGCVNETAREMARRAQHLVGEGLEGIYAFPHPYGCSQTGEDHARTRKLLAALAHHPNAAGVLFVHLGCENLQREQLESQLGDYDPKRIRFLVCQETEDELKSAGRILEELAALARPCRREPIPADELIIGMKCGGSDGLSGITANPVIGRFSDLLCAQGGTTVLTEVPEMFGAETLLMNRCKNTEIFWKTVAMIQRFKDYFLSHHEVVYENPSPGNHAGGITTLEDKSCGCVQKSGTAPIEDVLDYGERVKGNGLFLLYGPGNDMVSSTAMTAAGAHLILFSTGRGTPFGTPAPVLKISSNTALFEKKKNWMDFNAGTVADGACSLDEAGHALFQLVLAVAGGIPTQSERLGFRDISIFKTGITL
jgi:altronate hydrolase